MLKRIELVIVFALLLTGIVHGQITKGNWLVGGGGSFYSSKSATTFSTPDQHQESKEFNLNVESRIGYFLADRFAVGLNPYFSWGKGEVVSGNTGTIGAGGNTRRYGIGPFARYYILQDERPFNLLVDVSYQFGRFYFPPTSKGPIQNFSILAGPVIYFNSSVAMEFTLGYASRTEDVKRAYKTTQKGFQTGINFQFHLEKRND